MNAKMLKKQMDVQGHKVMTYLHIKTSRKFISLIIMLSLMILTPKESMAVESVEQPSSMTESTIVDPMAVTIRKNLYEAFKGLADLASYPSFNKDGIQWINTNIQVPDFNIIFNIEAQGSGTHKQAIEEALRYFETRKIPFMYVSDPSIAASDLKILEVHGLKLAGKATLMSFDLSKVIPDEPLIPGVVIKQVKDEAGIEDFSRVSDESYGFKTGSTLDYLKPIKNLLAVTSPVQLYVTYLNNHPVGISMLYLKDGKIAGNYWWCVVSSARNQGIGSKIVIQMLKIAKEKGYKTAIAQCYDTSKNIATRLGFQERGVMNIYANVPAQ